MNTNVVVGKVSVELTILIVPDDRGESVTNGYSY